jgi:hypothetical protein
LQLTVIEEAPVIYNPRAVGSMLAAGSALALLGLVQCAPVARSTDERPIAFRSEINRSMNLDEFRAQFVNVYRGGLHTHERRAICTNNAPVGSGCIAKVTIQAVGKSNDIDPRKPFKDPRVIAEIKNLDRTDVTEMFSLKPLSQATYYLMIDSGPDGYPQWDLIEVPALRVGSLRLIKGKKVETCPGFEHVPPPYSDVDFSFCGEHPFRDATAKAGLVDVSGWRSLLLKVSSLFRRSTVTLEPGEWMYCPSGCCT